LHNLILAILNDCLHFERNFLKTHKCAKRWEESFDVNKIKKVLFAEGGSGGCGGSFIVRDVSFSGKGRH
jgi:hypothetical protein